MPVVHVPVDPDPLGTSPPVSAYPRPRQDPATNGCISGLVDETARPDYLHDATGVAARIERGLGVLGRGG